MIDTTIICDGCGKPIIGRPGYPRNEYISISLAPIPMNNDEGFRYAIATKPLLERDYQFHSVICISEWEKLAVVKKDVDISSAS